MTLTLLLDGKFDEYFAQANAGNPLWIFVHIPKTAGSSLTTELSSALPPAANIEVDYRDASRPYLVQLDTVVNNFIATAETLNYRYASGHILAQHVTRIRKALPNTRCLTMLRHPVARLVSDYRWQRSPQHPPHEVFRQRTPTLASYIEQRNEDNKIAQYLVPAPVIAQGSAQACVDYIRQNYVFVGLQEMYPLSFRTIARLLLGKAQYPSARIRVNEVTQANPLDLTPELERKIIAQNALDMAIYRAFELSFREIRDDLIAYLDRESASFREAR